MSLLRSRPLNSKRSGWGQTDLGYVDLAYASYTARMAKDVDSAGVYFLSIEEFEWRPERDRPDEHTEEKKRDSDGRSSTDTAHED